jgi:hypothetical protein
LVKFYKVDQHGDKTFLNQSQTDIRVVAVYSYYYGSEGPFAFIAEPAEDSSNIMSSSGITLTVAQPTAITLSIERNQSTYNHVLSGNLRSESAGLIGKQVKMLVNDVVKDTLTTTTDGQFSIQLHLEPLNSNPTTYRIVASYECDNADAVTATASATTPNGTQYTVCTTTQYDYKSTQSGVTLTVEPPKTDVAAPAGNEPPTQSPEGTTVTLPPPKTPEQIQRYAIDLGWLKIWGEFSWSYPWFRTHAKLGVSLSGLDLWVHIGFNPVLPDEGVVEWSRDLAQLFASLKEEAVTDTFIEVVGLIAMYFSAKSLSLLGRAAQPWLIAAAAGIMIAKFGLQGLLLGRSWNDKMGMLASGIVNTILAILVYFKIEILVLFIKSVAIGMSLSVVSALCAISQKIKSMMSAIETAFRFMRDWIDIVEFAGDAILAAMSWVRFFDL